MDSGAPNTGWTRCNRSWHSCRNIYTLDPDPLRMQGARQASVQFGPAEVLPETSTVS